MEAEFYNTDTLKYPSIIKGEKAICFSQYGTSEELNEENDGFPILRLNEFDGNFIGTPAKCCNLIDIDTFIQLKLQKDDVLICRTNGNPKLVGKAAIVPEDCSFAYASYLFRVRPNLQYINSATLVTYLNSQYGRMEIERYSMQSNQANFSPAKFREISIPVLPSFVQEEIENLYNISYQRLSTSRIKYSQAQKLLQSALSISPYAPTIPTTAEKSLRESFIKTGRIDAEYYQPKYEHIENEIKDSVLECWHLTDGMIADANYNPESDFLYHYIELSDIGHSGEITGYTEAIGDELPTRARRVVQTDDVLLSYLEGSLTSCALIDKNHAGCLCSNGFYVLRDLPIQPEVMLMLLKSDTIQQLLHKGCSGHIMASISKDELKKIVFPTLDDQIQDQIAALIRESFTLRDEANQLLADARQLVEDTIENA